MSEANQPRLGAGAGAGSGRADQPPPGAGAGAGAAGLGAGATSGVGSGTSTLTDSPALTPFGTFTTIETPSTLMPKLVAAPRWGTNA